MKLKEFFNHKWEDGCIEELSFINDNLKLKIKDWKEVSHEIMFSNVFSLKLYNYLEEDISHVNIQKKENDTIIVFYSAWEEKEILMFEFDTDSEYL